MMRIPGLPINSIFGLFTDLMGPLSCDPCLLPSVSVAFSTIHHRKVPGIRTADAIEVIKYLANCIYQIRMQLVHNVLSDYIILY